MNKKGIFFTLLAIVIISIFALSYSFISNSDKRESVQKRVETLNGFVFSAEEDISRNLFVAGFRTIFATDKIIVESGKNISNFSSIFNESFFEGKILGVSQPIMDGATFQDMLDNLNNSARKINAYIDLTDVFVSVSQEDPWNIKVALSGTLVVEDVNNFVRWEKQSDISAYIPIRYFEDPLYIMGTSGKVTNKMVQTPYSPLVSGSNVANFSLHAGNSYYINSSSAPSFIDRLEGRSGPNENGVESLVNVQELSNSSIEVKNKSIVDYIYFSNSNPGPLCKISGMPNWVLINEQSVGNYGAEHLKYGC